MLAEYIHIHNKNTLNNSACAFCSQCVTKFSVSSRIFSATGVSGFCCTWVVPALEQCPKCNFLILVDENITTSPAYIFFTSQNVCILGVTLICNHLEKHRSNTV